MPAATAAHNASTAQCHSQVCVTHHHAPGLCRLMWSGHVRLGACLPGDLRAPTAVQVPPRPPKMGATGMGLEPRCRRPRLLHSTCRIPPTHRDPPNPAAAAGRNQALQGEQSLAGFLELSRTCIVLALALFAQPQPPSELSLVDTFPPDIYMPINLGGCANE